MPDLSLMKGERVGKKGSFLKGLAAHAHKSPNGYWDSECTRRGSWHNIQEKVQKRTAQWWRGTAKMEAEMKDRRKKEEELEEYYRTCQSSLSQSF